MPLKTPWDKAHHLLRKNLQCIVAWEMPYMGNFLHLTSSAPTMALWDRTQMLQLCLESSCLLIPQEMPDRPGVFHVKSDWTPPPDPIRDTAEFFPLTRWEQQDHEEPGLTEITWEGLGNTPQGHPTLTPSAVKAIISVFPEE